jgi:hypothetical protein
LSSFHRSFTGAVAILAAALLFAGPAAVVRAGPPDSKAGASGHEFEVRFNVGGGWVGPAESIPYSIDPVRFHFAFWNKEQTRISFRVKRARDSKTIRRIVTRRYATGRHRIVVNWDGRTQGGRLAPPGNYKVVAGQYGRRLFWIDRIRMHAHEFPVDAPHGVRGYIGQFGAPRVDGRTHEGFDITAACGSPLVAVRAGTIIKKAYDPDLYGNFIVLKGKGERRTYKYAHMLRPAPVRKGQTVRAGRRLGSVGQTGNAASTPCHLHIEIRTHGNLLNPEPLVNAWDW